MLHPRNSMSVGLLYFQSFLVVDQCFGEQVKPVFNFQSHFFDLSRILVVSYLTILTLFRFHHSSSFQKSNHRPITGGLPTVQSRSLCIIMPIIKNRRSPKRSNAFQPMPSASTSVERQAD